MGVVAMLILSMAVLSFALVSIVSSASRALTGSRNDLNAIYISEAAVGDAVFNLANGGDGNLGNADNPVRYGGAEYWVAATDLGNGAVSLVANGEDNGAVARVEMVVRSNAAADYLYQWAAFGRDSMTMASNARTDSYDSSLGSYADQEVNGSGSEKYASSNGDIGSNLKVEMVQNTSVWGDVVPGPDGSSSVAKTASVSGSTKPSDSDLTFNPIDLPTTESKGDWTIGGSETLGSGAYAFEDVQVDGTLTVVGPATLLVTNLVIEANNRIVVDATNGPVEIYVLKDFELNSNTQISSTTNNPSDVSLYLESDNVINPDIDVTLDPDDLDFDSNSEFFGTIYAPNAHIEINSNFQLYGSLVARSIHLDSNSKIHFDEALLNGSAGEGANGAYETICWRILPDEEKVVLEAQPIKY